MRLAFRILNCENLFSKERIFLGSCVVFSTVGMRGRLSAPITLGFLHIVTRIFISVFVQVSTMKNGMICAKVET